MIHTLYFYASHLVQPAIEIDDNFPGSVVVNNLKLSNVTWTENSEELSGPHKNSSDR